MAIDIAGGPFQERPGVSGNPNPGIVPEDVLRPFTTVPQIAISDGVCFATHKLLVMAQRVSYNTFMDTRTILSLLKADGWVEVAQKGSHVQLKHPEKPGRVTLPHPKRDLPIGTLKSIEQQSGLKLRR